MEQPVNSNRNAFAIKNFLKEYLDLRKDKDNELETVDSIRKGVEFKGMQFVDSDICYLYGLTRFECQFHRRNYWRDAYLSVDGIYNGCGAFGRSE